MFQCITLTYKNKVHEGGPPLGIRVPLQILALGTVLYECYGIKNNMVILVVKNSGEGYNISLNVVKFIYSEKATNFFQNLHRKFDKLT